MSFEDEHGLADKKVSKKGKQTIHKSTNAAIASGLAKAKASEHDSVNCDSDYCAIC